MAEDQKTQNGSDDTNGTIIDPLDNNYPLIVEFRSIAPGTYNHSREVANLLEAIGGALGLDVRKLKIAGFYHDIGKKRNPMYFTENQNDESGNPHDILDPYMSYQIITSHVAHTAEILINDRNIDRDIISWCTQHHGTTLLSSIFHKSESKDKSLYRYKGVRPQSFEAGLLMIADQVTSTIRSISQNTESFDMEEEIDKILMKIESGGQLDDIILKLGHLKVAKEIIKREMHASFHKRIKYDNEE